MPHLVSEKMGITRDQSVLVIGGPSDEIAEINLPTEYSEAASPHVFYDHVILFLTNQKAMEIQFPAYKSIVKADGKLWVAWPKRGLLGTDLNIKEVIRIGYDHGLVESTNLRIDDVWTALKFTHPKKDKKYNNSYGTLKH